MQSFRSMLCAVVALGLVSTSQAECNVTSFASACGLDDAGDVEDPFLFCTDECASNVTSECLFDFLELQDSTCVPGYSTCPKNFIPSCNMWGDEDDHFYETEICSGSCLQQVESNDTFSNTDCARFMKNTAEENCGNACEDSSFFYACGMGYNTIAEMPTVIDAELLCSDACAAAVNQSSWIGCKRSAPQFKAPFCRLLNQPADAVNRVIRMRLSGDLLSMNETHKAEIIAEVTSEIVNVTGLSASKFEVVLASGSIIVRIAFDPDVDKMKIAMTESALSFEEHIGGLEVEGLDSVTTQFPTTVGDSTISAGDSTISAGNSTISAGNSTTNSTTSSPTDDPNDSSAAAMQHGFAIVVAAVVATLAI